MSQESKFCQKCGAELPAASSFCPKCGTPVGAAGVAAGSATPTPPPAYARRHEKQEKQEKHEKNEKGEKHEKRRGGDLAGAITGGLVLILLGVLFYGAQTGMLQINWENWWQYFIIGMGVILIIQGLIRWAEKGRFYEGSFIGGAVLILVGLAFLESALFPFWPLVLVILGVAAIASAFAARRRAPSP